MANALMNTDEIALEIAIPLFRAMFNQAYAVKLQRGDDRDVVFNNPVPDCLPIAFAPEALTPEGLAENMRTLDEMERELREKLSK